MVAPSSGLCAHPRQAYPHGFPTKMSGHMTRAEQLTTCITDAGLSTRLFHWSDLVFFVSPDQTAVQKGGWEEIKYSEVDSEA